MAGARERPIGATRFEIAMSFRRSEATEESKSLGSKISEHSIIPCTSFRRRPESNFIYPSTRGRRLGSGFCRSDEYTDLGALANARCPYSCVLGGGA